MLMRSAETSAAAAWVTTRDLPWSVRESGLGLCQLKGPEAMSEVARGEDEKIRAGEEAGNGRKHVVMALRITACI